MERATDMAMPQHLPLAFPLPRRAHLRPVLDSMGARWAASPYPGGRFGLSIDGIDLEMDIVTQTGEEPVQHPPWRALFTQMPPMTGDWLVAGFGGHLEAGYGVAALFLPLLRIMTGLAARLGAPGMGWRPARLWSPLPLWEEEVGHFVELGQAPILLLAALDDEGPVTRSRGFAPLAGEELEIGCEWLDRTERAQRLVRLLVDRYRGGPFEEGAVVPGMVEGEAWLAVRGQGTTSFRPAAGSAG